MYIEPNSNIKIYHNVPLDNTYNHTLYFSSLAEQNTYFHAKRDIIKYNFQYILLLGDAGRRFLQIDIKSNLENVIISPNNRFYNVNYSPLIKYVDEEKFDVFKSYLRKWYCSCKTKYFPYKTYTKL